MLHQRAHHRARSISHHDSPPRHSPPHDPHYQYYRPYDSSSASRSPCPHCRAPATSFHMDPASGDLVCTQCGAVLDDHARDEGAEWREYRNDDDAAGGQGRRARGGDAFVDESKWVGGLVPTKVSSAFYPGGEGGTAEERRRLATVRSRLKRTHNMIENMVEQSQKERYSEMVLASKARDARLARGELGGGENDDGGIDVEGDYEGLMTKEQHPLQNRSHRRQLAESSRPAAEEKAFLSLKDKKWSLQDSILLYGTLDQVRHWCADSAPLGGEGWTQSALEAERAGRVKRIDAATRSNLRKLAVAFTILESAGRNLNLLSSGSTNDRAFSEAVSWLLKFITKNDGIRIRGLSGKGSSGKNGKDAMLSLSLLGPDHQGMLSSSKSSSISTELGRLRQYAALASAMLYLSAKRTGVGRTLAEVCSAFGTYRIVGPRYGAEEEAEEALVRPKHCSKAMQELRTALPEVVEKGSLSTTTQDLAATLPVAPTSSSSADFVAGATPAKVTPTYSMTASMSPSSEVRSSRPMLVKSERFPNTTCSNNANVTVSADEEALADLTRRVANSLELPPSAVSAAAVVAVQCARDARRTSSSSTKPRGVAREKSSHIRPGQRRKRVANPTKRPSKDDAPDDVIAVSSILLVCTAGGTMQKLARQALANGNDNDEQSARGSLAAWRAWDDQPPWHRDVSRMERRTGVARGSIVSYYSRAVHPRRSHLLGKAAAANGEGDVAMLRGIAAAVPLMSLRHL